MSVDRTGDELGIDRQRQACLELLKQRGWTLSVDPFVDNDRSAVAGRKPRPAFQALLRHVAGGEVDAIVAWSLDRLTRNARDRLALVEACRDNKVLITLVRGSDIDATTPAGRLTLDVLGSVAAHEIEVKSDRQKAANKQAAEQGRRVGGRRPFGYLADGVTVNEVEAQAVRDGYHDFLSGVPLAAIAADWNKRGLRTGQRPWKRDAPAGGGNSLWRHDSVRRLLLNARYAGKRTHGGEVVGDAVWPALVPTETFEAAKSLLGDEDRRKGGGGTHGIQLLTGIALCGNPECGLPVHGGGAGHGKPIYRCSSAAHPDVPKAPGRHPNRLAAPIDEFVTTVVLLRLSRADAAELLADNSKPDVPALRRETNALRIRLDGLAAEFATQVDVSMAEYRKMTEALRKRLAELDRQIEDAGRVSLLGDLVRAEDASEAWERLDIDRRRAVIDELVTVRIHTVGRGVRTFRPESVGIEWKIAN